MSILIENVMVDGNITNIYIENEIIKKIGTNICNTENAIKINGLNKVAIPGFINGHAHTGTSLMKGYADDMYLYEWLSEKIWPFEKLLTSKDIYNGVRLACLEMIKSGITFFQDSYFDIESIYKGVNKSGLKASISELFFDLDDPKNLKKAKNKTFNNYEISKSFNKKIDLSLAPHSIYTVSKNGLEFIRDFSLKNNLNVQIHLSETKKEVNDCIKKYQLRPVEYLNSFNFLEASTFAAHMIWLDEKEIDICKKKNVNIVYCPISNLKLLSGNNFLYKEFKKNNIKILIGTDGNASGNNLDILENLKIASLSIKNFYKDPKIFTINESLSLANKKCYNILKKNGGKIEEGYIADILLIDTDNHMFVPNFNFNSNLIYSANNSCINTNICNGEILMHNRIVKDEKEILKNAKNSMLEIMNKLSYYNKKIIFN